MPFDWSDVDAALADASKKTDDALAARISSLTRFTGDEVKQLFPRPADVQRLSELMQIVQASTTERQKIDRLAANIETLGGTVLKLLRTFV
jgi:hypothetical protein